MARSHLNTIPVHNELLVIVLALSAIHLVRCYTAHRRFVANELFYRTVILTLLGSGAMFGIIAALTFSNILEVSNFHHALASWDWSPLWSNSGEDSTLPPEGDTSGSGWPGIGTGMIAEKYDGSSSLGNYMTNEWVGRVALAVAIASIVFSSFNRNPAPHFYQVVDHPLLSECPEGKSAPLTQTSSQSTPSDTSDGKTEMMVTDSSSTTYQANNGGSWITMSNRPTGFINGLKKFSGLTRRSSSLRDAPVSAVLQDYDEVSTTEPERQIAVVQPASYTSGTKKKTAVDDQVAIFSPSAESSSATPLSPAEMSPVMSKNVGVQKPPPPRKERTQNIGNKVTYSPPMPAKCWWCEG